MFTETTLVQDGEYTYEITSVVNGVYTFTDVTSDSYTYEVVLNEDGTLNAVAYVNGTKGDEGVYTKRIVAEALIGKWTDSNSNSYEFTENSLIYNYSTYELTLVSKGVYTFTYAYYNAYYFTVEVNLDGTITVTDEDGSSATCSKVVILTVPENIKGSWYDEDGVVKYTIDENGLNNSYGLIGALTGINGDVYTFDYMSITFNEDKTSFTYYSYTYTSTAPDFGTELDAVPAKYVATFYNESGYEFTLSNDGFVAYGTTYTITKIYESRIMLTDSYGYSYKVLLNSDGTITYNSSVLSKISSSYYGQWINESNVVEISATSIKVNNVEATSYDVVDSNLVAVVNGESLTLVLSDSTLTIGSVVYTRPVINSELYGSWYDQDGIACYTFSADGVYAAGYNSTYAVISITDNVIVVKGSYGNITITVAEDKSYITVYSTNYTKTAPDFGSELDAVPTSLIGTYTDSYNTTYTLSATEFSVVYSYGTTTYTITKVYETRIVLDYYGNTYKVLINEDGTLTFNGDVLTKSE